MSEHHPSLAKRLLRDKEKSFLACDYIFFLFLKILKQLIKHLFISNPVSFVVVRWKPEAIFVSFGGFCWKWQKIYFVCFWTRKNEIGERGEKNGEKWKREKEKKVLWVNKQKRLSQNSNEFKGKRHNRVVWDAVQEIRGRRKWKKDFKWVKE